ncbi:zinc finger matrin-type protein 1 isoform X1 [Latimeria chalumnae]|uniref:zinc finger matrin-type protein 1 isoform X1 n=2 Tax=Latimeria chalumnae TaxID=7897 RepID=UPI00313A98A8
MESESAIIPQLVESFKQKNSAFSSSAMAGGDSNINLHTNSNQKGGSITQQSNSDLFTDTFCKVCGAVLQFESQRISHYEGKKHAQKVRLYFQMVREQEELFPKKTQMEHVNFQDNGGAGVDENKFCSLCNMVFSSKIVAQSHYVGKVHAKKLKQLTGEQVPAAPVQKSPDSIQPQLGSLNKPPDTMPVEKTTVTEKFKDDSTSEMLPLTSNILDLNDSSKYCKLCSAPFNNPLMAQQHYNGKKHKRNETRKRMVEEMGEEAIPTETKSNTLGVGNYTCPICSITLTSIETYQSHMQGNKHQVKETKVASLVNEAKKKHYNSFQDELDDYIKVQKARGLEPKTSFRKGDDTSESYDDEEEVNNFTFVLEEKKSRQDLPYGHSKMYSDSSTKSVMFPTEGRLPQWPVTHCNHLQVESMPKFQYCMDYVQETPLTQMGIYQEESQDPSSIDSCEEYRHVTSDDSSSSHRKERLRKRKLRKEKRERGQGVLNREEQSSRHKKKRSNEDTASGKEDEKHRNKKEKREKEDTEFGQEEKAKHKKEKNKEEKLSGKESKSKHKKEKKKREVDPRSEEEKLWDESILGVL